MHLGRYFMQDFHAVKHIFLCVLDIYANMQKSKQNFHARIFSMFFTDRMTSFDFKYLDVK